MEKLEYNSKDREQVIDEMDKLVQELQKHHQYLKRVNKKLKEIERDLEKIEQYYYNEWVEDYDNFKSDKYYGILSQDLIYDVTQNIQDDKVKILKRLAKTLRS